MVMQLSIEFVDYIAKEKTGLNTTSYFDLESDFQGHKGYFFFFFFFFITFPSYNRVSSKFFQEIDEHMNKNNR